MLSEEASLSEAGSQSTSLSLEYVNGFFLQIHRLNLHIQHRWAACEKHQNKEDIKIIKYCFKIKHHFTYPITNSFVT